MTKQEVRSKIEKDIESGDVELYISVPYNDESYAIIRPHIYPKYQNDTEGKIGRTAFRFDWKISERTFTRESALEKFTDIIHKGLTAGRLAIAPIWFKRNEELNQVHG